jgi:hypothetical protein
MTAIYITEVDTEAPLPVLESSPAASRMMPFDLMPLRAWWLRLTPPRWQPTRWPGNLA